jgi:hypothetical membrane protein
MAPMNRRRIARQLSLAGIIGPILFTCLVVVQGILQPDYSHVRLPVSALAAWPAGWIQVLNFYIFGTLTIAFAVALHGAMQRSTGMAGVGLLALSGVGLILAGTFSWEMVEGVPTETRPHVVGAILSFVGTGAGYLALSRRMATDAEWRHLSTYTLITGAAILLTGELVRRALALRFEPAPIQRTADWLDVTAAYAIGALAAYWLIERTTAFFA